LTLNHRIFKQLYQEMGAKHGSSFQPHVKIVVHETRGKKLQNFYQLVVNMLFDLCEKVMHARSIAWRCCDGKGRAASVQCELLLAATFIVLC